MDKALLWLDGLVSPYLPVNIYEKLDWLYSGTLIVLGAGLLLMAAAAVFMIARLRALRKHAQGSAAL